MKVNNELLHSFVHDGETYTTISALAVWFEETPGAIDLHLVEITFPSLSNYFT